MVWPRAVKSKTAGFVRRASARARDRSMSWQRRAVTRGCPPEARGGQTNSGNDSNDPLRMDAELLNPSHSSIIVA